MKKLWQVVTAITLSAALLAGCGNSNDGGNGGSTPTPEPEAGGGDTPVVEATTLTVGASITPHAEILEVTKEILAEQNITLEIIEFTDYVQPNLALENGDLDANYFQHLPYLEQFNEDYDTALVPAAQIHYEPFGIYAGRTATIEELADGAIIGVPNDGTNEGRALLLLQDQGLITLKDDVQMTATVLDIEENPQNLDIRELEAAQLTISLQDLDLAVINGNYALQGGLNASTDALVTEAKDSLAATTYANVLAVREGEENDPAIQALVNALQSEAVREFIENTYEGAVVPIF